MSRFFTRIIVTTSVAISIAYCFINGIPGQNLVPIIPGLIWKFLLATAFVVTISEMIIIGATIGGFCFIIGLHAYLNRY